jgi:citronellyl-CoA dehydrogenase
MFEFDEQHETLRKTVRDFAEKEIAPFAEEWDDAEIFPREIFKKAGDLGLLGMRFDPEAGGSGLTDYRYTVAYGEALTWSKSAGVNMALMVQSDMATPVINDLATKEQKQEFLTPAMKGEKIAALGVSEPSVGSDVANLKTTAKKVAGGDYVINGAKTFITNGTRADFITLLVRTGDVGFGGVSIFLFPTNTKGYAVGKKLKKIGNRASDTAELSFDNCRLPARYLLGEENMGFIYLMNNFQSERLIAAVAACAGMKKMIEGAIQYGHDREAFGKPIIKHQVWRHKFAEMISEVEAAQQLTYMACELYDREKYHGGRPAVKEISMAKLVSCDLIQKVAYTCQQFHGGYGYMLEYDISRAWVDARLLPIGGGTSEIMKEIIAKFAGL